MKFCYNKKKTIPKQCSKVRMAELTAILITMTLPSMLNTKPGGMIESFRVTDSNKRDIISINTILCNHFIVLRHLVCPPSIQWNTNSTTCNEYCVNLTYTEGQLKDLPKRCSCQKNEDVCQSNAVFQWFTNQTLFHSSCYYDICNLSKL